MADSDRVRPAIPDGDGGQTGINQNALAPDILVAALESLDNAVVITGRDGTICWVNTAFTALTGYSSDEALGQNPRILKSGRHDEAFYADMWRSLTAGRFWQGEIVNRRKDGSLYVEHLTISPVLSESGEPSYFVAVKTAIGEAKRLEESVRQSEVHLQMLFDGAPVPQHEIDENGIVQRVNRAECDLLGYQPEELVGRPVWETVSFREREQSRQAVRRKLTGEQELVPFQREYLTRSGRTKLVEIHERLVRDVSGTVVGIHSTLSDISERMKSAANLRHVESLYDGMFLHSTDAVSLIEVDEAQRFRFLAFNPAHEASTGLDTAACIGKEPSDVLSPELAAAVVARYRACLDEGMAISFVETLSLPAGLRTWLVRLIPSRDASGRITHLTGISTDLTEREATASRLRQSEQRFRSLVESQGEGVVIIDPGGVITFVNAAGESLVRASQQVMLGRNFMELVIPEDLDLARAEMAKRREGKSSSYELRIRRNDGAIRCLLITATPQFDLDRKFVGTLAVFRDITQRKDDEVELRRAKRDAEQALRVKADFLSTMSHEIRTPMNGIIGMTGLLLDTELTFDQKAYATAVRTSADALLSLVNDILDFSKIEAGRLDLEWTPFDLEGALEDVISLLSIGAADKGLEMAFRYPPHVHRRFLGDAGRVRQIVTNLVGNAIKFTDRGHVLTEVSEFGEDLLITVEDTGIGISNENLPALFQRFSQVDSKSTTKYGGTGLGLAIAKQLTEMMGGSINVQSTLGVGSRFLVRLPLRREQTEGLCSQPPDHCVGRRVLIVDGHKIGRSILAEVCRCWGMLVLESESLDEALLRLLEAEQAGQACEILFLDSVLAGPDSSALSAFRTELARMDLPLVLLISAAARHGTEDALHGGELTMGMSKPVQVSRLRQVLGHIFTSHEFAEDQAAAARIPLADATNERSLARREFSSARVLVVEDNIVNQRVASGLLGKFGCRVEVAANGREAVQMAAIFPFDLILMDCRMPEMDGFEATRAIRNGAHGKHVPIIAMTAAAMREDRELCLDVGMDDYISKPVRLDRLAEALNRWLPSGDRHRTS